MPPLTPTQGSTGSTAPGGPTTDAQFLAIVTQYRGTLKPLGTDIKNLKAHAFFGTAPAGELKTDKGEMIANIMLAYRHMEDARMRLGKVFEAYYGEGIGNGPLQKQV